MLVFGDFKVYRKDRLIYSGGTDIPGELCYSFSISSYPTQVVNIATWSPVCSSLSPVLLDFFFSDPNVCSTMTFCLFGNSDHAVVSVSTDFPSNSKGMPHLIEYPMTISC